MRTLFVTIAILALAGCGADKSADTAATSATPAQTAAPAAGNGAVVAAAPHVIELTNQKLVHECPKCGMDFDAAGTCSMDGAELVATKVDYLCPADGKAVESAGKCPRCPMNARVEKTAMAPASATNGN